MPVKWCGMFAGLSNLILGFVIFVRKRKANGRREVLPWKDTVLIVFILLFMCACDTKEDAVKIVDLALSTKDYNIEEDSKQKKLINN